MKLSSISWICALTLGACALGPTGQIVSTAVPADISMAQTEIATSPAGAARPDEKKGDQRGPIAAAGKEEAPLSHADWGTNVITSKDDQKQPPLTAGAPSPQPVGLPMPLFDLATGSLPTQRLSSKFEPSPEYGSLAPKAVEQANFSRRPRSPTSEESQTRYLDEFQRTAAAMVEASKREYRQFDGQCACPEDIHFDGSVCGERSAYSLQRPSRPLCYTSDVAPDMVADFWRTGSIIFSSR
jgi:hypothetical protein